MQIISDIKQTDSVCQKWRDKGESISFVPTMGCLHEGHLSLIKKAQTLAAHVVVSIFVNPLQFDNADDFSKYPTTLNEDTDKLVEIGVDLIFIPNASSFYPEGENQVKKIEVGEIASILEGAHRDNHFAGVATVVKRFFDIIQPDIAIFGEKDFQQLIVIKQLVEKFTPEVEIVSMPTFREQDGLAMSSRNVRLSDKEREKAPEIYRQLEAIKTSISATKSMDQAYYTELERIAFDNLKSAGFVPDYVAIRDTQTLLSPQKTSNSKVVLAAARLGKVRLIDNILV